MKGNEKKGKDRKGKERKAKAASKQAWSNTNTESMVSENPLHTQLQKFISYPSIVVGGGLLISSRHYTLVLYKSLRASFGIYIAPPPHQNCG